MIPNIYAIFMQIGGGQVVSCVDLALNDPWAISIVGRGATKL
jgi:hypothetical protein